MQFTMTDVLYTSIMAALYIQIILLLQDFAPPPPPPHFSGAVSTPVISGVKAFLLNI